MDTGLRQRIALLIYEDVEGAQRHLVEVFGLGRGRLDRDDSGRAIHAEVDAGDGVIWLHRHAPEHGLVSPRTVGAATAMTVVMVDDVDAHFRRVVEAGGAPIGEPYDAEYGFREYSVSGPEGDLWSFMQPID